MIWGYHYFRKHPKTHHLLKILYTTLVFLEHLRFLIHAMCFSNKNGGAGWFKPVLSGIELFPHANTLWALPCEKEGCSLFAGHLTKSFHQTYQTHHVDQVIKFSWICLLFGFDFLGYFVDFGGRNFEPLSTLVSTAVSLLLQVTCALVPPKPKEERPDTKDISSCLAFRIQISNRKWTLWTLTFENSAMLFHHIHAYPMSQPWNLAWW